jgi:hypothetical protein
VSAGNELVDFIRDQFRSVWALELLLFLKNDAGTWSQQELVGRMRASEAIVGSSLATLCAGGLILWEKGGSARYCPASKKLDQMVNDVDRLYATKAGTVRRLIVTNSSTDLQAFSDAFRLRRDT